MVMKCQPQGFFPKWILIFCSGVGSGQYQCFPVGLHWEIFPLALVEPESVSEAQHVVPGYYTTTVCSQFH